MKKFIVQLKGMVPYRTRLEVEEDIKRDLEKQGFVVLDGSVNIFILDEDDEKENDQRS